MPHTTSPAYRAPGALAYQQTRGHWIIVGLRGYAPARYSWREWKQIAPTEARSNRREAIKCARSY